MIPRFSPDYRFLDIGRCLWPARRDSVALLEEAFARLSGHYSALSFRYGRTGLFYLLKALGAEGKKVVLPSYTCVVVAHAVALAGARPYFLDNAPGGFQPSQQDYIDAVDADTAMVIPTHIFGMAQETARLYSELKKRWPGIFVLQDCAHSFFCSDLTGRVVTAYGDGALFGMNISKLVNSVKGGILTLKDTVLAGKIRKLVAKDRACVSAPGGGLLPSRLYVPASALAFEPWLYGLVDYLKEHTSLLDREVKYYDETRIELPADYQLPMSDFEADIGLASLARLAERVRRRGELAGQYCRLLAQALDLTVPEWRIGHTWSHFPVLVRPELREEIRRKLQRRCAAEIGTVINYSVADMPCYGIGRPATCPNAARTAASVLNLPLTSEEGLLPGLRWGIRSEQVAGELLPLLHSLRQR